MTKKELLRDFRDRVYSMLAVYERAVSDSSKLSEDESVDYYRGRVDLCNIFLGMLDDYGKI